MKSVKLLWVAHFHQPIGNFSEVIDRYVAEVCRPFIDRVTAAESVRFTVHFSGILLEHLASRHPDFLEKLRVLVRSGRLELMGGGFYEPVLTMIPSEDAIAQLRLMADWLEQETGQRPRGAWLPEFVWDEALPQWLQAAGYSYTILKESQLVAAGVKAAGTFQPYRTESLRHPLVLYPVQRTWSKAIPYQPTEEVISAFKRVANRDEPQIIVLAQRGDQYEALPGRENVFQENGLLQGWLRRLEDEKSWIETSTFAEHYAGIGRLPLVYVPPGSSYAVESGSLPSFAQAQFEGVRTDLRVRHDYSRIQTFLHGGSWPGFLAKYPEIHHMHQKMLWLRGELKNPATGKKREEASRLLLQAQCHSAYWHVERGGCYANYLRDGIYQRLVAAEKLILNGGSGARRVELDVDGVEEILFRDKKVSLVIDPAYGGSCREFDYLPTNYNLANTFTRRPEAYHGKLKQAPPLDWYVRHLFQDHLIKPGATAAQFSDCTFVEYGDFVDQPYNVLSMADDEVVLIREGGIYRTNEPERRPLQIIKTYRRTAPGQITVQYRITNQGKLVTEVQWAVENNYTCLAGDSALRTVVCAGQTRTCGELFEAKGVRDLVIRDETREVDWKWTVGPSVQVIHYPVATTSVSGQEPRTDYQGSALVLVWPLHLEPGETQEFSISVSI